MARVGVCKDRLAEAFQRFGRVPVVKKTVKVSSDHLRLLNVSASPFWSAGGLLHDGRGRVLLLRHVPSKGWGDAWLTPGGLLEEGETVLEGLERELCRQVAVLSRRVESGCRPDLRGMSDFPMLGDSNPQVMVE